MRYASVCSGVEAASLAWLPLGWEAAWFSEIEPFPCAVLKERFPGVPNLGDMTKIDGEKYAGTVDLLVGGTPCQGFSVAGKQGGLDDPRSALCLAYCRLLETMRPRWFVWENVPGVFSTNGGNDFRAFLREIDAIGYSVAWRVLDAQYVRVDGLPRAVPQRRRRVFVVGHLGDWRHPASVLFEPGSLLGDTPPRRIKGKGVARSLTASTGEAIEVMATGQANAETTTNYCVNLTCNHEAPIVCAGFSGGQGENAGGIGYQEEVAPTIRSSESGSNQVPDILCQYGDAAGALTAWHDSSPCADRGANIVYENHAQDKGVAPTLIATDYKDRKAVCFQQNSRDEVRLMNGDGEIVGTLVAEPGAKQQNYLCYENHAQDSRVKPCGECCPQINAKAGTGGGNLPIVSGAFTVRRLTPVECERLMGFPDNWTRIPWRGKPAEDCPDSPRYKACGNSMCVNVMRWIGMRIEYVERKMNE